MPAAATNEPTTIGRRAPCRSAKRPASGDRRSMSAFIGNSDAPAASALKPRTF
jgi:hypothetical protein